MTDKQQKNDTKTGLLAALNQKAPLLYALIGAVFLVYLVGTLLLRTPTDFTVNVFGTNLTTAQQEALEEGFLAIGWDRTGDGRVHAKFRFTAFGQPFAQLSSQVQSNISVLTDREDFALTLCGETALEHLGGAGRLALWSELENAPQNAPQTPAAIALTDIPALSGAAAAFDEPMYLCLRYPCDSYDYVKQSQTVLPLFLQNMPTA